MCLENFGSTGFSNTAMLGWYSSYQSQSDEISTHPSPPSATHTHTHQMFTFSPWKLYSNLLLLEVGDKSVTTKNGNKNFQQEKESFSRESL